MAVSSMLELSLQLSFFPVLADAVLGERLEEEDEEEAERTVSMEC
jgi:hypothetical protein